MTTTNKKPELIQVEGAPDTPNLKFRGFRGKEDYAHILAVINGSKVFTDIIF